MERTETYKSHLGKLTKIAILSALAWILMVLEFMLPFTPPFLKMDFSDIPALLGAFALGPISGILIKFITNVLHLSTSNSLYVGEIANFVIGAIFAGTAGLIYRYKKTRGGAVLGMIAGTLAMTVASVIANYYVMLPFYATVFHISMDDIVNMARQANALVKDVRTLIVFVFVPFNLIKGLSVSFITALFYKRISPILHR
jgi:riboflavin transporter FmnP